MIRAGVWGLTGYEAAAGLAAGHRSDLEKLFSGRFLRSFDALAAQMPKPLPDGGDLYASGGVFGTIWRALDALEESARSGELQFSASLRAGAGCRINLPDIPLRQEIVEICELFDENPYEAQSSGAYLVIWDEDSKDEGMYWFHMGDPSLDRYDKNDTGQEIVPIGYITCSKDRLIINGDMIRYLTPYRRQMTDICARKKDRRSSDGKKR